AILADDRVPLAGVKLERDVTKRADSFERFRDGRCGKQRGGQAADDKAATPTKANLSGPSRALRSDSYQASLKPNCAARPSSAVVMVAAVAFEMFVSGL